VHELAHAFEDQGGTAFPTLWLSEIYANLALHAFVAKRRPSDLANLTTLPDVQSRILVFTTMMRATGYTSLHDFEPHFLLATEKTDERTELWLVSGPVSRAGTRGLR
jgi:hypothetical protein